MRLTVLQLASPRLIRARRGRVGGRFRRGTRWLDSVGARLLVVILFSVVPMAVLSGFMAWHSYQAAVDASSNRAAVVAEALMAQSDEQIAAAERMLHALAGQPALHAAADCNDLLRLTRALQTTRLVDLGFVGPGQATCGSPDGAAEAGPPVGPASSPTSITTVVLQTLLGGDRLTTRPVLRLTLAVEAPVGGLDRTPGRLVADMRLGWTRSELAASDLWRSRLGPGGDTEAWLVGRDGRRVSLCDDCGWTGVPANGRVGHASPIRIPAPAGHFLKRAMIGDVDLLVTTLPSRAESQALSEFVQRVIAIALLLAVGLVAVWIGASRLIVAPLRAVTLSVTEWRRAGAYDPRHTRSTPVELRQLSRAFAQATQSLAAHEERLRRAETKQELLIKEIHHRVKNNLQIIASLLNLQANRIRQPEARAEFASARDRVRALATLHRHLYSEGELHTLNMRSFLEELCGQLFQAIGEKEGRRIRLVIEAPEIVMSTDQAVPMALVVTEAVSNAIKYAFPGGRDGVVSVRLAEEVAGIATLVIEDNGIGIPAGRAETESGVRDGIGIQLIRGFARQLGATLEVTEGVAAGTSPSPGNDPGGTRYRLMVPLHPEAHDTGSEAAVQPASA